MRTTHGSALLLGLTLIAGCAPGGDSAPDLDEDISFSEDEVSVPGFDRDRVLSDAALVDAEAMTEEEIQAFLEETPYGNESVLATYTSGGLKASRAIAEASETHRINPLAILTRAQMEQSLIGKSSASKKALDFAFGCGCPDNQSCSEAWRGFHKQVDCMASHMREYLDDLEGGGATVAGWAVGKKKKALDGWVTPKNKATAALYTYTPWIGQSGFGNLAHFQIWKKFAGHVGYAPAGPGGCAAKTFPSGKTAQALPGEAMTEAYVNILGPLGLTETPTCFLDPKQLIDPATETSWAASSKVSGNFTLSEFLVGEPTSRTVLVEPVLVQKLQAIRASLATSVTIVEGFRSPEEHAERCASLSADACEATLPITLGRAVVIKSSKSSDAMMTAAKSAGVGACWSTSDGVYVDVSGATSGCPGVSP